ncbi:phage virion morphogenesis protein [Aeromonas rivuli]|uniref:phage virion morphogenesis protein n=1 Tax=Aeromonas rivuli TaxID=648794 RepID=UPI0006940240|nr:phage virion morphogenesis protein [Aeromonas rivuli]
MISLTINQGSMLNLLERLDAASLPPAKRRRITAQIGREVAKVNRQRIKAGKAPDGTKWAPTKSQRKHKRLTGLAKRLRSRGTEDAAIIDFDSRFAGMIANQQHQGMSQPFTAAPPKPAKPKASEKGKKKQPFQPTDDPCLRSQAVRLRALGYKVLSGKGKRRSYRKPSLKWMQAHISVIRAAILIRTTTGETRKNRWTVETPARPMLPKANNDELLTIAAKAFKKMGWGSGQTP